MPLVSIIVPVFKSEKTIVRCLASVHEQSLEDWELLLVNDGSPDNSMSIISQCASEDSRIRILDDKRNLGPMVARYQGFINAHGDYITFLDSDDWLPSYSLSVLFNKARESGSDIVCGNFMLVDEKGNLTHGKKNRLPYGNDKMGGIRALLNREIYQTLCAKLFKREVLQDYDYTVIEHCTNAEDAGTLIQIMTHISSIVAVDSDVYYYNNENLSSSTHTLSVHAIENICKSTVLRESVLSGYPELEEEIKRYFTNNLYPFLLNKQYRAVIMNYGLQRYISTSYILKYVPLIEKLKLATKLILSVSIN